MTGTGHFSLSRSPAAGDCSGASGRVPAAEAERPLLYRGQCQASPFHLIPPAVLRFGSLVNTRLSLLFEVGVRPPHDGMRRMGRPNLSGTLAADCGRISGRYELTPPVVPVRTFFRRSRTRDLLDGGFSCVLRGGFTQPQEPWCSPCSTGTRYHRPTSGAELQPDAWRPRRSLDASHVAGPLARPMPSATTILPRE
jgi:hypothetical protein